MPKKNLIIGAIWDYEYCDIEPFLKTLRATGYQGDVLFFYNTVPPKTLMRLTAEGILLEPFTRAFPYSEKLLKDNDWSEIPGMRSLGFICFRFLLAYAYLKQHGEKYENVLLADVRDIIFQHDPFDFPIQQQLCCFTEREDLALKDAGANRRWVEDSFGTEAIDSFGDCAILCAGSTIGRVPIVIEYLHTYFDTLAAHPSPQTVNDQGLHNYVVYTHFRSRARIYPNNASSVLTLGLQDTVSVRVDGKVINKDGSVPAIVHQYDRHYWLAKRYYSPALRFKLFWNAHLKPSSVWRTLRYQVAHTLLVLFPWLSNLKKRV